MIKVNDEHLNKKINYKSYAKKVAKIDELIRTRTGAGNDYLGWENLPSTINKEEVESIKKYAKYVRENYDILVVCGIGGSYLGAKGIIDALKPYFKNNVIIIIYITWISSSCNYRN